jgi:hypothetical protein
MATGQGLPEGPRLTLVPVIGAVLVCLLNAAAFFASAQIRTKTDTGVPFDEPILVRVRDVLLRVPAGYLWPVKR